MLTLIERGGPVMYPIVACSIVALAIFLERLWSLRRGGIIPRGFLGEVEELIRRSRLQEAVFLCRRNTSPMSNIIMAGVDNVGKRRESIKEIIEEVGQREASALEKFLGVLGTIASISPLLGLLGTVTGFIRVFRVITAQGVGDPSALAGGISEALLTTAAGLMVAIPTLVVYRYLVGKAESLISEMEESSLRIVDLLKSGE